MAPNSLKAVSLTLIFIASITAQKKPGPAPIIRSNTRDFRASCDAVWPVAATVLASNGWGIRGSDRLGGILTLEWTRGETSGSYRKINPIVDQYAIKNPTGFWTREYYGFRMMSAQAISVSKPDGCSYTISVVYQGLEVRAGGVRNWESLPSNGSFEAKMLTEIEEALSR